VPLDWNELDRLKSGAQYDVKQGPALARRRKPDPWDSLLESKQRLTRSLTAALEA
jgi:bifunctional non-homologous end joining protein LigD